jgi:thiamine kinase
MVPEPSRARALSLIPADVLAHVPGFTAGGTTAWATRLPGGTMNSSYRVQTSAGRFVVRIHHPNAASLGADHEREARLHAAAASVGLAPALIHLDASYRFMVMEHVSGALWSAEDFAREDRIAQLGSVLQVLHLVTPPAVAPFDIAGLLSKHYDRLRGELPAEGAHFAQLMDRATTALHVSQAAQRPRAIVHNDLHHTNLIGTDRLFLVDWEYAAVTDPACDLACLLAYYPQAVVHRSALLEASRLSATVSPEMLAALTWLFVLLSYFWYRTRRLSSTVPPEEVATERALLARLV